MVTNQTHQQKLIAIAEACGWLLRSGDNWITKEGVHDVLERFNSLDAMQQAVLMQDEEFQNEFSDALWVIRHNRNVKEQKNYFHQLTFTDWQDAFCEVLESRKGK